MHPRGLGKMEQKFAELIWEREPVASGELAKLCGAELGWKKSTAYTMLKRLCEKGLFENRGGTVAALISREDFAAARGERLIDEEYGGSLPLFFAAFARRNRLGRDEIDELERLIAEHKEG